MKQTLQSLLAFVRRDIAMAVSYPAALLMSVLSTIGRVVIMWLPAQLLSDSRLFAKEGGFLAFSIVGTSVMGVFMASYGGFASAIRSEQAMGTFESLLMCPIRVWTLVIGSNLWSLVYSLLDALLTLSAGVIIFRLTFHNGWLSALLIVALTNLSFIAVGILAAAFAVVYKRGDPFRIVVGAASFLLGGVVYPVDVLPKWLVTLSEVLPTTHGVRALRGVLISGRPLLDFGTDLLVLCGFAAVLVPLGIGVFSRALRRAARDGSLLQY